MPRPDAPDAPMGYRQEAYAATRHTWRVAEGRRCRWGAGFRRPACGRPCVAELRRGDTQWWAYCEQHLYGRWIEDGQFMAWRLVPDV